MAKAMANGMAPAVCKATVALMTAGIAAPMAAPVSAAEEPRFRYEAAVVIEQPAPIVRLPLPMGAYAQVRQPNLADLRLVDALGQRVPFALLEARTTQWQHTEQRRPAALYPLPPRRPGEAEPASPLEVQVVGDRITVRRGTGAPATVATPGAAMSATVSAASGAASGVVFRAQAPAPGWLFDLGEAAPGEAPASALRLVWAAPAEFTAAYEIETSADLHVWQRAGNGQILSLGSAQGLAQSTVQALVQPLVPLPTGNTAAATRFVRLRWLDAAAAPVLTAAEQVRSRAQGALPDPPATLTVSPSAPPAGANEAEGALHYDLGGVVPLLTIDLALPAGGTRVAPVRVQGRLRAEDPWRELAGTVFYRFERPVGGSSPTRAVNAHASGAAAAPPSAPSVATVATVAAAADRPPPLPLEVQVRYLRLVPDVRAGRLPAAALTVQANLASVVFAPQGQPPFRLLAGAAEADPGALPLASLIPKLEEERDRFGRASLGPWTENATAARQEAVRERMTTWRPALLWALLLAGVAGLGFMVWRLARAPRAADPPTPTREP